MSRTRCYRNGVLTDEDFPDEDVSEHLAESSSIVWIDLCAPGVADLQLVADELGLHRLAVEDAARGPTEPQAGPLRRARLPQRLLRSWLHSVPQLAELLVDPHRQLCVPARLIDDTR